jgi:hypothetical protein
MTATFREHLAELDDTELQIVATAHLREWPALKGRARAEEILRAGDCWLECLARGRRQVYERALEEAEVNP